MAKTVSAAALFGLGMVAALIAAAFLDGWARDAFLLIGVAEALGVPLLCCDGAHGQRRNKGEGAVRHSS